MSYPSLVLDGDDAEAGREELLDEVVLFVVEGGAAEVADGERPVDAVARGVELLEARVAGVLDEVGDAVHRPVERALLPMVGERGAILDGGDAVRAIEEAECGRPF